MGVTPTANQGPKLLVQQQVTPATNTGSVIEERLRQNQREVEHVKAMSPSTNVPESSSEARGHSESDAKSGKDGEANASTTHRASPAPPPSESPTQGVERPLPNQQHNGPTVGALPTYQPAPFHHPIYYPPAPFVSAGGGLPYAYHHEIAAGAAAFRQPQGAAKDATAWASQQPGVVMSGGVPMRVEYVPTKMSITAALRMQQQHHQMQMDYAAATTLVHHPNPSLVKETDGDAAPPPKKQKASHDKATGDTQEAETSKKDVAEGSEDKSPSSEVSADTTTKSNDKRTPSKSNDKPDSQKDETPKKPSSASKNDEEMLVQGPDLSNTAKGPSSKQKGSDSALKQTHLDGANDDEKPDVQEPTSQQPKKPLSAYNMYFKDEREKILARWKNRVKGDLVNINKEIGKQWKELDPETKQKYKDRCEEEREVYVTKMKRYREEQARLNKDSDNPTRPEKKKAKSAKRSKPKPSADGKPRRPLSAYNIFFRNQRQRMKKEMEAGPFSDISFGEMGRVVGAKWKSLNQEQREEYDKQAQEEKSKYFTALQQWEKNKKEREQAARVMVSDLQMGWIREKMDQRKNDNKDRFGESNEDSDKQSQQDQGGPQQQDAAEGESRATKKQASKPSKQKGGTTSNGNNLQRPKRPLSAYNIFFRQERENMLNSQGKNKLGFRDMAKVVGSKWKLLDDDNKKEYEELAVAERLKYFEALEKWNEQKKQTILKEQPPVRIGEPETVFI